MPNVEYKGTFVVSAYLADDEIPARNCSKLALSV